jgi:hypothetical protein
MFEAAAEEAFAEDRSPMDLAGLRLQLERYRSRWDHFDQATREVISIPPTKIRICEKGYLVYIFQSDSKNMLCTRVIRLPSTCNGVARREWVLNLEMLSPEVVVLGMTLQPELDLLVVVVSTGEDACVRVFTFVAICLTFSESRVSQAHTLRLSDGKPYPAIPTLEPIPTESGFRSIAVEPSVTGSRLAFVFLQLGSQGACTFRVYELYTGQTILVLSIRSLHPLTFLIDCYNSTNPSVFPK